MPDKFGLPTYDEIMGRKTTKNTLRIIVSKFSHSNAISLLFIVINKNLTIKLIVIPYGHYNSVYKKSNGFLFKVCS